MNWLLIRVVQILLIFFLFLYCFFHFPIVYYLHQVFHHYRDLNIFPREVQRSDRTLQKNWFSPKTIVFFWFWLFFFAKPFRFICWFMMGAVAVLRKSLTCLLYSRSKTSFWYHQKRMGKQWLKKNRALLSLLCRSHGNSKVQRLIRQLTIGWRDN